MNIVQDIQGKAPYVNSGPDGCAHTTFAVESDGCCKRSMKGAFHLFFENRSTLKNSLNDDYEFDQCPSGASGGTDYIKHGNTKIGEEQTTIKWTLHFQRLRR